MKLTDLQIKRIKPNVKPFKVSDGGGLFLWANATWRKALALDLQV